MYHGLHGLIRQPGFEGNGADAANDPYGFLNFGQANQMQKEVPIVLDINRPMVN
jgi:hypothetical protein